jgi:hypothetical protein
MWVEVVHFIKMCDVCQKIKPDTWGPKGKLLPHSIPLLPYDVVTLDLITGLPKLEGFDAILVIVDKLTKYIHYLPTSSDLDQRGFARLFMDEIVYGKGIPKNMFTNQDAQWSKGLWDAIARYLGLDLTLSTSHHPQMDGKTERANATLEVALREYTTGNRWSWAKWLKPLTFAYNSMPHSSTGYSPFFLLQGYSPHSPASLVDPIDWGLLFSVEVDG